MSHGWYVMSTSSFHFSPPQDVPFSLMKDTETGNDVNKDNFVILY